MQNAQAAYLALLLHSADRPEVRSCCSDLDHYRSIGVDVDARPKRHRTAKLRAAIPAALSVFRELMRRPVGGTVVVLVPRTEHPAAPEDQIVFDDQQLRAS